MEAIMLMLLEASGKVLYLGDMGTPGTIMYTHP